jgi:hypothetical protein
VFNPGERVEGFTSPLWIALLAATTALKVSPLFAAGVLGTLSAAAIVLVSVDDARRSGPPGPFAAIAPVALATWTPLLLWAVSGLETCLFAALMYGAFACYRAAIAAKRPPGLGLGVLVCGAFLARPEGALAVLAIGAAVVAKRNWRAGALVLAPPLVAAMLLVLCRAVYYRDPLPNPFYAKLGGTLRHYVLGAQYLGRFACAAPLGWLAPALLLRRGWREVPGWGASVVFLAMWSLNVLRTGGDYFQYFRFMVPAAPLLFVLGAHGAHHLCRLIGEAAGSKLRSTPRGAAAAASAAIAACVIALQYDPIADHPQHGLEWATRWSKLGRALGRALPGDTTVAASAIGAVGYYAKLPMVDLLGLVDHDLARRPRTMLPTEPLRAGDVGHEQFDVDWSLRRNPGVVVFMHAMSAEPFTDASEVPADLWVERRLIAALRQHPEYRLVNLAIEPHQYWGLFIRSDLSLRPSAD